MFFVFRPLLRHYETLRACFVQTLNPKNPHFSSNSSKTELNMSKNYKKLIATKNPSKMYYGIGLQTPRGSGTNGYIQTNKFLVKSKTGKVSTSTKGYEADQGTGGISRKPNKDILEHDRKRQIELKLVVFEDKLIKQGYSDAEIAEKLDEARNSLEAASASQDTGTIVVSDSKVSDTQSHQIAARKEKQMERLHAALGVGGSEHGG